ncbi:hypothetical protein D9M71_215530 [compost metagenome]
MGAQLQSLGNTQLVLRLLANSNHVTSLDLVGRNVHGLAVDADGLVGYQLTRFGTSGTEAHAVYDVVQTAFQDLQQVLTSGALTAGCFLVVTTELTLQNAVDTTDFLLLTQLQTVVGQATTALAVLTRDVFGLALGVEGASAALQEQVGAFTARQFALGTNVTSHSSLSPITRDVFSADGSRCAGSGSRR